MDSGVYTVTVKIEKEEGFSKVKNAPIIKRSTENYIVRAGSTTEASEKMFKYMESCPDEWRVHSVKELNIIEIID